MKVLFVDNKTGVADMAMDPRIRIKSSLPCGSIGDGPGFLSPVDLEAASTSR